MTPCFDFEPWYSSFNREGLQR